MRSRSTAEGAGPGRERSLAGGVALVGLPVLILLLVFDAITAYRDARAAFTAAQDRTLRAALTLLASTGAPRDAIPGLLAESLGSVAEEVRFAIVDPTGLTVAGDADLPYARPDGGQPLRFRSGHHRGEPVRVAAMLLPRETAAARDGAAVLVVAEPTRIRRESIWRSIGHESRRHLLGIGAATFLAWLWMRTLRKELAGPTEALAERAAEDLTPLPTDGVAREVRPLVDAVNDHLSRLAGLMEASRRFSADVAHQLRTPLTLLGAQAQMGLRQTDPAELRATIESISTASRSAQRLCNQMLTLSRIEAVHGEIRDAVRVDLTALLRETALDLSMVALEKRIDLSFEDGGAPLHLIGNEIMLHELFSNLIDNALRYTPREGRVRIELQAERNVAEVVIEDSGPGIPPERRDLVFQRFHRRLDRSGGSGSGLGLAIAHQIALVHRGSIDFDEATPEHGFRVRVRLLLAHAASSDATEGA